MKTFCKTRIIRTVWWTAKLRFHLRTTCWSTRQQMNYWIFVYRIFLIYQNVHAPKTIISYQYAPIPWRYTYLIYVYAINNYVSYIEQVHPLKEFNVIWKSTHTWNSWLALLFILRRHTPACKQVFLRTFRYSALYLRHKQLDSHMTSQTPHVNECTCIFYFCSFKPLIRRDMQQ